MRPTGSSPTTGSARTSSSGRTWGRATPSTCASSRTSMRRRASWSREIERLVDEGASRDEIAVFYRTNAQSRVLEDMLVRYGVGYQVIGGTRFYERAEIKDALAYLTLLVNPADTVAFSRVVNSPRRGIGATSQGRLVGYANTIGEPIWDVAAEPESVPGPRAGRDQGGGPLHVGHGAAARAGRGRRRRGRPPRRDARGDGLHRGAPGGADDRGAGPAREPRGAGRRGARVRRHRRGAARSRSSSSSSRSSPSRTTCATTRASSR